MAAAVGSRVGAGQGKQRRRPHRAQSYRAANAIVRGASTLGRAAMVQQEIVSVRIREERHVADTGIKHLTDEFDALGL